jgi:hypothetical protein
MVGVGPKGEESIAARVSIVNQYGKCVYDKYVKPTEPVTDYRTAVSGIRPKNLKQGRAPMVQKCVGGVVTGFIPLHPPTLSVQHHSAPQESDAPLLGQVLWIERCFPIDVVLLTRLVLLRLPPPLRPIWCFGLLCVMWQWGPRWSVLGDEEVGDLGRQSTGSLWEALGNLV